MNDQEAGGRIMAQAFHDEMNVISKEAGVVSSAMKYVKGIGTAAKGGLSSAKRSMAKTKGGSRSLISRAAKATGTGAKSFGKKLTKGQAAGLAAGGAYAAS